MLIRVKELVDSLSEQHTVRGNLNGSVRNASPIDQADEDSICFYRLNDERAQEIIQTSRAKVIICSNKLDLPEAVLKNKALIQVSNPRLTYSRLLARYFPTRTPSGIHPTAVVDKGAKIGDRVYIGPLCNIGKCEIGNNSVIESQAFIDSRVKIGQRVIVQPGAIIGVESLAFERNEERELEHFPQLGRVVIEDDVRVGPNSVIGRGQLPRNVTLIGKGTKLGSLVIVAHGVIIGKHCMVIGHSTILGSVKIGDYTQISTHVCVRQGVKVGSKVLVGMGSTVLSDVPDNVVVVGTPAKYLRENSL